MAGWQDGARLPLRPGVNTPIRVNVMVNRAAWLASNDATVVPDVGVIPVPAWLLLPVLVAMASRE